MEKSTLPMYITRVGAERVLVGDVGQTQEFPVLLS